MPVHRYERANAPDLCCRSLSKVMSHIRRYSGATAAAWSEFGVAEFLLIGCGGTTPERLIHFGIGSSSDERACSGRPIPCLPCLQVMRSSASDPLTWRQLRHPDPQERLSQLALVESLQVPRYPVQGGLPTQSGLPWILSRSKHPEPIVGYANRRGFECCLALAQQLTSKAVLHWSLAAGTKHILGP